MKTSKIFGILALICSITNYAQTISIHKTTEKISINGDLSDWKNPFLGPFTIHNSGQKASQNTMVSLSWNDENLYIAYRSTDSKIVGKSQKKDAPIFSTEIKIPFLSLKTIKNGSFKKPKIGTKWNGNTFRIDYYKTT
ncbi:DOMON domain-containing protein [Flavobacterium hibernum]|uniref:hypothetical protein n=1 Tax=Flavobacterium hibernum TaxID=37752 RepID=UPI00069774C9|nr:hypothetical protein [Flavobacterium hibernum]STO18881.1 Uncharacterised protein [Flavobacterium hibernum]